MKNTEVTLNEHKTLFSREIYKIIKQSVRLRTGYLIKSSSGKLFGDGVIVDEHLINLLDFVQKQLHNSNFMRAWRSTPRNCKFLLIGERGCLNCGDLNSYLIDTGSNCKVLEKEKKC